MLQLLGILKTVEKSLFSDWPGEFRATADPCYDLHTALQRAEWPKRALQWWSSGKNARQTHRVHSVHTAGAENTIF